VVEIYRTARRHGITDEDTLHAIDRAIVIVEQDEERTLYLGPARAGNLLEVVTLERVGSEPLAIHSSRMTEQYRHLLQGLEADDE